MTMPSTAVATPRYCQNGIRGRAARWDSLIGTPARWNDPPARSEAEAHGIGTVARRRGGRTLTTLPGRCSEPPPVGIFLRTHARGCVDDGGRTRNQKVAKAASEPVGNPRSAASIPAAPPTRRDGRVDLNTRDMRIIEIVREKRLMSPRRNAPLEKLRRLKPLHRGTMQTGRSRGSNLPTLVRQ